MKKVGRREEIPSCFINGQLVPVRKPWSKTCREKSVDAIQPKTRVPMEKARNCRMLYCIGSVRGRKTTKIRRNYFVFLLLDLRNIGK